MTRVTLEKVLIKAVLAGQAQTQAVIRILVNRLSLETLLSMAWINTNGLLIH